MNFRSLNNKGFNLVELAVGMAISSLFVVALGTLIYISQKNELNLQRRRAAIDIKTQFILFFSNERNIRSTLLHPLNTTFECIQTGTDCFGQGGDHFDLYYDSSRLFTDANTNPAKGYSGSGFPCDDGEQSCRFKINLTWQPICTPADCVNPLIRFRLNIIENLNGPSEIELSQDYYTHVFSYSIERTLKEFVVLQGARVFLYDDGQLMVAGSNSYGELGRDKLSTPFSATPIIPRDNLGVDIGFQTSIIPESSNHVCTLTPENEVNCWGRSNNGEVGTNLTVGTVDAAARVHGVGGTGILQGIERIFGGTHAVSMAISTSNEIYVWGLDNGRLGVSPPHAPHFATPVRADQLEALGTAFQQVIFGEHHACALLPSERVICWGNIQNGELGNGESYASRTYRPPDINRFVRNPLAPALPLENVKKLVGGHSDSSCAILGTGNMVCWGRNEAGHFGVNGGTYPIPMIVPGINDVRDAYLGRFHTCAIRDSNSEVWCWGQNIYGVLGIGTDDSIIYPPQAVPALAGQEILYLGLRTSTTCAITTTNRGYCWGRNQLNQIHDIDILPVLSPQEIDVPF